MKLRRLPEDFQVTEQLRDDVVRRFSPARRARGHAVYRLTKRSLTTEEATRRLARVLGVRPADVAPAGLKDKHAVTVQHASVRADADVPAHVAGEGWEATLVGWSAEAAAAAWIRRNSFRLVVRGLSDGACAAMDRAAAALACGPARLMIINYFGDQRFGSARHGRGFAAASLVRGDFERALRLLIATPARKDTGRRRDAVRALADHWGRWAEALAHLPERGPGRRCTEALAAGATFREAFARLPSSVQRVAVEAYQSHLWNGVARRLASGLAATRPQEHGALTAADVHGEMVFPVPGAIPGAWRTLELPMPAPQTRPVEPWRGALAAVLAEEGVTLEGLIVPGLRRPAFGEAWRPFVVLAERLVLGAASADEQEQGKLRREVAFDLPRGAYATVVARALGATPPSSA